MINVYVAQGYCKDDISLIENYEQAIADTTQTWECHHKDEIDLKLSRKELIIKKLYYGVPANRLIFLTKGEHTRIHWTGRKHTKKTKDKMKLVKSLNPLLGEKNGMFGKHHSEEAKKKMSEARKGAIPWNKGKHPERKPHSEETKRKMSEAMKAYWEHKRNSQMCNYSI